MKLTTMKWDGARVQVDCIVRRNDLDVVETIRSADQPPDQPFIDALHAFKPALVTILQLPRSWAEPIQVTKVAVDYKGDDDQRGLVISAVRKIEDLAAPLNIHCPRVPEGAEAWDALGINELLEDCTVAAVAYLNGERAQQEMFPSDSNGGGNGATAPMPASEQPKKDAGARVFAVSGNNIRFTDPADVANIDVLVKAGLTTKPFKTALKAAAQLVLEILFETTQDEDRKQALHRELARRAEETKGE